VNGPLEFNIWELFCAGHQQRKKELVMSNTAFLCSKKTKTEAEIN